MKDNMKAIGLLTVLSVLSFVGCSVERKVESIEDVSKYAPGIWVGNSGKMDETYMFWYKYIINADGSYIKYNAVASANDWGKPEISGSWVAGTNKYTNTGERYFFIDMEGDHRLIFLSSTKLRLGQSEQILEKGDKFPFSK